MVLLQHCNFKEATPPLTWGPLLCSHRPAQESVPYAYSGLCSQFFFIMIYAVSLLRSQVHHFRLQFWKESVCLSVDACEIEVSGADVLEG